MASVQIAASLDSANGDVDAITPAASMDRARAVPYLESLLGRTLRVQASDGRLFVGEFKCTDKDRNIILGLTHEYRAPDAAAVNAAAAAAAGELAGASTDFTHTRSQSQTTLRVNMTSRFVGL
ncbi:hypothetical protein KEM52_001887, partial [Ascosphaera acerosa]